MAAYEWIVAGYFAALTVSAWLAPVPMERRLQASALGACVLAVLPAALSASPGLRSWLPHFYLAAGYWMPALLVPVSPGRRFEEWLLRRDGAWRRLLPTVPPWLAPPVELAYLLCSPLVPLAFAIVWTNGTRGDIDRFWFAVLLSGYCCYGTLPWLVSRPPRLLRMEPDEPHSALAAINRRVLARVSHGFNTFPSGHVAVTAAAAVAVVPVSRPAAAALAGVVAAICVGAVSGRYHYVVDVVLGLAIAGAVHLAATVI